MPSSFRKGSKIKVNWIRKSDIETSTLKASNTEFNLSAKCNCIK